MAEILDAALVRSGTWGSLWLDGEQVAECYGCQIKLNKTKEDVARCRTLVAGKKLTGISGHRYGADLQRHLPSDPSGGPGAEKRTGPAAHLNLQSGRPGQPQQSADLRHRCQL